MDYTDEEIRRYHLQRVFVNGQYKGVRNDPSWPRPGCEDPARQLSSQEIESRLSDPLAILRAENDIIRKQERVNNAIALLYLDIDSRIRDRLEEMMKCQEFKDLCDTHVEIDCTDDSYPLYKRKKWRLLVDMIKNNSKTRSELKMLIKYELMRRHKYIYVEGITDYLDSRRVLDIFNSYFDNYFMVHTDIDFIKENIYKLKMFLMGKSGSDWSKW